MAQPTQLAKICYHWAERIKYTWPSVITMDNSAAPWMLALTNLIQFPNSSLLSFYIVSRMPISQNIWNRKVQIRPAYSNKTSQRRIFEIRRFTECYNGTVLQIEMPDALSQFPSSLFLVSKQCLISYISELFLRFCFTNFQTASHYFCVSPYYSFCD